MDHNGNPTLKNTPVLHGFGPSPDPLNYGYCDSIVRKESDRSHPKARSRSQTQENAETFFSRLHDVVMSASPGKRQNDSESLF
jgi:hypothetical protein